MKIQSNSLSLFILAVCASYMPVSASSWWPFAQKSAASSHATTQEVSRDAANYERQLDAFIKYHNLPNNSKTKQIYDYIKELRSIHTLTFKSISFDSIKKNFSLYSDTINRAAELINLLKAQALLNTSYGPICCKEIQKSTIDAQFRTSSLCQPLIWFACEKILALTELALSNHNLASLVLPMFKDQNLILTSATIEHLAQDSLQKIQAKWAPHITLTKPIHYMQNKWGMRPYNALQHISHMAQQLIDELDPLWFAKKHPARHAFMSASMRLTNNSALAVNHKTGRGQYVPQIPTPAKSGGGASAGPADSVAARRLQRYDAAPAITDDSDDEGDGEGAGTLNGSHPGAVAGAYDDMPALEFVGSDNEGDGEGAEESKEGEAGPSESLKPAYTPSDLIYDIRNNDYKAVKEGLKQGVNVNQNVVLQQGYTLKSHNALHEAVTLQHTRIVELLIQHKANVNVKAGTYLDTPLHEAVKAGNIKIINILLNAHAHANATDNEGFTPLHYAISMDYPEGIERKIDVVNALLTAGADTQTVASTSQTPLTLAEQIGGRILDIVQTAATEQRRWSPGRSTLMSTIMRLANNSKLKVDDRAGRGKLVPDTSTAAETSGGASASASDSITKRRLQRYDAAPAITDDSDDEGDGEGAGTLNGSHPGAVAGAYDDMPALEFVGSDDEGDGEGAEESKGGKE